jgi:DNA-binding beta-propeller fold protein YncE
MKQLGAMRILIVVLSAILLVPRLDAQTYVNYEGKQTRPICLSPDGSRLFAVNTPDARLSVFDVSHPLSPFLIAEIPVGVEPVSVNVRNNDEAWVVNEVSDSVSIVSVSNRIVMDTIYAKDEPADVVFAGGKAFVSESRNNQIGVFDVTSHVSLANIDLFGQNPRSLAVNSNATKVYAAFTLSGNRTTLVTTNQGAPPQITNGTPPMNTNLPAPPRVNLIVDAMDPAWTNVIPYTMPDNDVVEIDVASMTTNRYFPRVGSVNFGLAIQPGSGDLFVANTDARNLTHFEPGVRGFFETNQVSHIDINSGAVTRYDLNPNYNPTNFTLLDRTNALAQPTAAVFDPTGTTLYVAAFGSDRIAYVDPGSGNVTQRIELCPTATGSDSDPRNKRGPRGLALNPGTALYVLNRIANTISIVNLTNNTLVKEIPTGSYDPTPSTIRNGRGFLYDAKLSGNGTVACAACHIDAEMDTLAWDLGDPQGQMFTNTTVLPLPGGGFFTNQSVAHPMKGPMTTQTLRGLNGLDPLHWRGDRTNFNHFIIAFPGLLGSAALSNSDMNAYRDFINTIQFEPNPNQTLDRNLPASFDGADPAAGKRAFLNTNYVTGLFCNSCHAVPTGTGRFIINGTFLRESQDFKVPHLRNIYQKTLLNRNTNASSVGGFGFVHDGQFQDLFTFLSQPVFAAFSTNTIVKTNLQAFLLCFDTGTAPAVGYTRTLLAANVNTPGVSNDWNILESQAAAGTNIDLIVKGTIDGQRHGLLYQAASNNYTPDTTNLPVFTRAQLVAKVSAGDVLSVMGVPPGSGQRMGIDRNLDGVLDADTPQPSLQIGTTGTAVVVQWPLSAAGYNLEVAPNLSSSWSNTPDAIDIFGTTNVTTNAIDSDARFYRLHQP